jgi:hypothetical protein
MFANKKGFESPLSCGFERRDLKERVGLRQFNALYAAIGPDQNVDH